MVAEERRRLDTSALVTRMQEVEAKADEAIRVLVAEHAEVLRKVRRGNTVCHEDSHGVIMGYSEGLRMSVSKFAVIRERLYS